MCPNCNLALADCTCKKSKSIPRGDGIVRLRREVKGRKGKTVTTISGILLTEKALRDLAAELKRKCNAGGSVKDGTIIIQGDHCDKLMDEIKKRGFIVKRAGG
jgi:translation initiation factor 1